MIFPVDEVASKFMECGLSPWRESAVNFALRLSENVYEYGSEGWLSVPSCVNEVRVKTTSPLPASSVHSKLVATGSVVVQTTLSSR